MPGSSRRYQNASDGVRFVRACDTEDDARILALRAAAQVGIADIEKGRFRTFNSPDELRRHIDSLASGHDKRR